MHSAHPMPSRLPLLRRVLLRVVLLALIAAHPAMANAQDGDDTALAALARGGHVALMRHALAPGIGDPADFRLGDCATQRNLSDAGREQARRIGARFRERGIEIGEVRSSRWCRCLETARLLGLGDVIPTPALDSFFRDRATAERQTASTRALIRGWNGEGNLLLVTHQVNITALVGGGVGSGEIIVVRADEAGLVRVGRLR
ncbi:histidine phosphatase family protein [Halomonas saccharevitans]|uniref:Histidine phosphatase family protein n=1 Tax=Halomonas saccharevitans TaxID=416872 RepID=A0A1I6XIH7_9GAMM|nr:histidine phosphatase family protein [Halomonas saccharevitans]MDT8879396.1 histidine phosphatase family protein [Halomonas saccharevitans]SFT37887.1 Phosphohistidine phosphatase SixA [Halomonas saccharevitans]